MTKSIQAHIQTVTQIKSLLGEGPVWDSKKAAICWVDILNGKIYEYCPSEEKSELHSLDEMVGAIAICKSGNFLAALKSGLAIVNSEDGSIKRLIHPEEHIPENRFNDGKCDPMGRFWVGSMNLSEKPKRGHLYMIKKDWSFSCMIKNVSISNGLAWSPDHEKFYYIDSPTREVAAFDYDILSGKISNRKVIIAIPENEGFPDGMTIDREGKLWIAHWDGWQVSRWDPQTGKKMLKVSMPVARVTSCTFGGKNLGDLFITTAKTGLSDDQLTGQPLAGSTFVIKECGFHGYDTVEFEC